ncbi:hypothetical protein [Pseudomonas sp. AM4(2022)]|uniref:hypothetical protein n=1 Tax=Pseudomonas sp. AM4(2022) TaxID=2983408 RepID=UPI002E804D6E|nr:hypothetical protein [Pseudomonas sp. AM4(2022)]
MHTGSGRILIVSKNPSTLFAYARTLNHLGYFLLCLCNNVSEVVDALEAGKHFEYLVYDAFDLPNDAENLKLFTRYRAILSVVAIADVNSQQRQNLILWAKAHDIPLRGVLQTPLRPLELYALIGCGRNGSLLNLPLGT